MDKRITKSTLCGTVTVPSSKSAAHRALICAFLSGAESDILMNGIGDDVLATVSCLYALGGSITKTETGFHVSPGKVREKASCFCKESGSTLRFLIPVAAALGTECTFSGAGRLPQRPVGVLLNTLKEHGIRISSDSLPFTVSGKLTPGTYLIDGSISSQYITGLMLALSFLGKPSEIVPTTPMVSSEYIRLTADMLNTFGIRWQLSDTSLRFDGGVFAAPSQMQIEADWSSAAPFLCLNRFGNSLSVPGLNPGSRQADRRIADFIDRLPAGIDASDIPDLVPLLSLLACFSDTPTVISGAGRLRTKESDRLCATKEELGKMGANIRELPDGLQIFPSPLHAAEVTGHNDHRIAMMLTVAGLLTEGTTLLHDAGCVSKSFPDFFSILAQCGGNIL